MTPSGAAIGHELERLIEWCGDDPTFETRCSCGWASEQLATRTAALIAHEDHVVGFRVALSPVVGSWRWAS